MSTSLVRFAFFACCMAAASCGSPSDAVVAQCVDQCDRASDCPDATGSCLDGCEEERAFAKHIECKVEYEAMLDCLDTAKDVCDQFAACPTEVSVYFTCFGDFCVANPDDSECPQAQGAGGAS
jgi:hypothetical protein